MSRTALLSILLLLMFASPLAGCFYSRELSHTRRDLERQIPHARFDRTVTFNLGPATLHALRWMLGAVPEDAEEVHLARDYLGDIERVKVGIYHTDHLPSLSELDLPRLPRFERGRWEVALKHQDDREVTWLLYRERDNMVHDMYVVVLSDEELVLVRFEGHLNRLLKRAVAGHHDSGNASF